MDLNFTIVPVILNFLILLLVLVYLFWKPLFRVLDDRRKMVKDYLHNYNTYKRKNEDIDKAAAERLKTAERKAMQILEQARRRASDEENSIINGAKEERLRLINEGNDLGVKQREEMLAQANDLVLSSALDLAARIASREITPERHQELIDEALRKLGA
ncbi:F0F1 ATP synthase subunit B [bacterium]|nr:F0F1 ATP synthase subunit B [candidate division CSSED10-310 bacterium]